MWQKIRNIKLGLFPKVLIAITVGSLLGLVAPDVLVRIFNTFNAFFAQILKFIVPLLVLGLVTPSVARLGRGAGKMVLTVMIFSYISTIGAGFFAFTASSVLLPNYVSRTEQPQEAKISGDSVMVYTQKQLKAREPKGELMVVQSLSKPLQDSAAVETAAAAPAPAKKAKTEKELKPYFELSIPPICNVLTALLLSFILGVGAIFTGASSLRRGFDEFGDIVKMTIERIIIPLLPFYIFTMMCDMSATGKLSTVMGSGVKIIATGVVLSICYLVLQYVIAGAIARKNPLRMLHNIVPAYLTGFSICSSSAVIPVTLDCTLKNGVSKEIANFVVPLCSTVHMCGSTIKLLTTAVGVMILTGMEVQPALVANFILMQGIAAVAAPGVMGGVLMASIGLVESIMGFSPMQSALMMTIYLALDGYGPACNVSGDGAITVIIDKLFGRKFKAEAEVATDKQE